MKLMIVESPSKAKKIAGFLGAGWRVEACRGHVRDLPDTELGIDVEHDFRPMYVTLPGKGPLIKRLIKAVKDAEAVYVATDPDREGEAIAWHLLAVSRLPRDTPVYRTVFHAITKEAVLEAVTHPRPLDLNLVEAQQARRIVDRLVGYLASPLAAKALASKVSAGRVQSVCLRLVIERESEIEAFKPEQYWTLSLKLAADEQDFRAKLHRIKEANGTAKTREPLERLIPLLQTAHIWVQKAVKTVKPRAPLPPFTTSSLQQAASKGLGLSPEKTMALAQMLYEQGWITYLRTDGVSVAPEAQMAARDYIAQVYGRDHHPSELPIYTTKTAHAQDAHEAIRPTDVMRLPQDIEGDGAALYSLIWTRFIASQMSPALYTITGAVIQAGKAVGRPYSLEFRASGRSLLFAGFLKVYDEPIDEGEDNEESASLPLLQDNQPLTLVAPQIAEHHTHAPTRYTEAALIQALEQRGIGRPSTYASMVKTVKEKGYVALAHKRLLPTETGLRLCDFLTTHFADVLADGYTARLETQLDEVAAGKTTRLDVLRGFWQHFQPQLHEAAASVLAPAQPKPLMLHPAEE